MKASGDGRAGRERKIKMEFNTWMQDVSDCVEEQSGLDVKDLPDCLYHDWFDDGTEPEEAARKALEESGFFDFAF